MTNKHGVDPTPKYKERGWGKSVLDIVKPELFEIVRVFDLFHIHYYLLVPSG